MPRPTDEGMTIDELARLVQRGFLELKTELKSEIQAFRTEVADQHAQNSQEHEAMQQSIEGKPDYHEVVKRAEFDSLEQRVTQLELK